MSAAVVSCGKDDTGAAAPAAPEGGGAAAAESQAEENPAGAAPDVPPADYGGHEFTVLLSLNSLTGVVWNDFRAEEQTGDVINDAIYMRNVNVEEKYNIKIKDVMLDASDTKNRSVAQKMLKNSVSAGDHAYDAAMLAGYAMCDLASGGYLTDMNDMAPLDLSKPW